MFLVDIRLTEGRPYVTPPKSAPEASVMMSLSVQLVQLGATCDETGGF